MMQQAPQFALLNQAPYFQPRTHVYDNQFQDLSASNLQQLGWFQNIAKDVSKIAPMATNVAAALDPKQAGLIKGIGGAVGGVAGAVSLQNLDAAQLQQLGWFQNIAKDVSHIAPVATNVAAALDPKQAGLIKGIGGAVGGVAGAVSLQNLGWFSNIDKDVKKFAPMVTNVAAALDPKQAGLIHSVGGAVGAVAGAVQLQDLSAAQLQQLGWFSNIDKDVKKFAPMVTNVAAALDPKQAGLIHSVGGAVGAVAGAVQLQDLSAAQLQQLGWFQNIAKDVSKIAPMATNVAAALDPKQAGLIKGIGGAVGGVAGAVSLQNLDAAQLQQLGWFQNIDKDVTKFAPMVTNVVAALDPKQAGLIHSVGGAVGAVAGAIHLQDLQSILI